MTQAQLSTVTAYNVLEQGVMRISHTLTLEYTPEPNTLPAGATGVIKNFSLTRGLPIFRSSEGQTFDLHDGQVENTQALVDDHELDVTVDLSQYGLITWIFPMMPVNRPVHISFLIKHDSIQVTEDSTEALKAGIEPDPLI